MLCIYIFWFYLRFCSRSFCHRYCMFIAVQRVAVAIFVTFSLVTLYTVLKVYKYANEIWLNVIICNGRHFFKYLLQHISLISQACISIPAWSNSFYSWIHLVRSPLAILPYYEPCLYYHYENRHVWHILSPIVLFTAPSDIGTHSLSTWYRRPLGVRVNTSENNNCVNDTWSYKLQSMVHYLVNFYPLHVCVV